MKQYDNEWINPLKNIVFSVSEVPLFTRYQQSVKKERELFFDNQIENPQLSYKPELLPVGDIELQITQLEEALRASNLDAVVLDLYLRKLLRQRQRYQLLQATATGNDEQFVALSTELYGKPHKRYFSYVARRVDMLCENQRDSDPEAAKRLQKVVGKISTKELDISTDILPTLDTDSPVIESVSQVKEIFTEVLERNGMSDVALVTKTDQSSHFSVQAELRQVFIPTETRLLARSKPLTVVGTKALAEHEIGVHMRRAVEGSQQKLRLLEIGLDDYLAGEEGVASYVQQQVEGASEFYGFDRYFAISLAMGTDGEKRDFRAVFQLMQDYYSLHFAAQNKSKANPADAAWDICMRVFRGTTGQTTGCVYTKDKVYLEGNIETWHLLSEKPHVFEQFFIGKFSPLLTHHVKSLQTLEIIEGW